MNPETFRDSFGEVADAPGGVGKLRGLILELAIRGHLSHRESSDEPVADLLANIADARARLVAAKKLRSARALPPVADDEVSAELPQSWAWRRLGDLTYKLVDGSHNPPPGVSVGRPMLSARNISSGVIRFDMPTRLLAEEAFAAEHRRTSISPGDLLMCIVGTVGGSALVPDSAEPFALQRSVAVIRTGLSSRYLKTFMDSPTAFRFYEAKSRGSAQNGLYLGKLALLPVAVPPIQEQHRIVERVDELMAMCDELEQQQTARVQGRSALTAAVLHRVTNADMAEDLRAAINSFADRIDVHLAPGDGDLAALKRLRQTILDLAVRGRLTYQDPADEPAGELLAQIADERDSLVRAKAIRKPKPFKVVDDGGTEFDLPAGWQHASLGHLVLVSDSGWSPACVPAVRSDESEWGVLKVSAVSWGEFRPHEHKLLTPGLTPRPHIEVQDGDFLMSRANTSALVGRSVVVSNPPPRLMLSDKHVRLRFLNRTTADFANLVNSSSGARSYYVSVATGTSDSMRNITRAQILALRVALPPLAEQARIVDRVNELQAICDQLEQQLLAVRSLRGDLAASIANAAAVPA